MTGEANPPGWQSLAQCGGANPSARFSAGGRSSSIIMKMQRLREAGEVTGCILSDFAMYFSFGSPAQQ
jgi:hypothetical protein